MPDSQYLGLPLTACFVVTTEVAATFVDRVIGQMHINIALQYTARMYGRAVSIRTVSVYPQISLFLQW